MKKSIIPFYYFLRRMYAAAFLAISAQTGYSAIVLNDVIGVDFGATAPTSGLNYNQASSTTTSIVDLIRTSDGASTGVGFSMSVTGAGSLSDRVDGGNSTGGVNDATVYADITQNTSTPANDGGITLTFTGLDDALTYNITGGADLGTNARNDTAWTIGATTLTTDATDIDNSLVTFTNVSSSGGQIVIELTDPVRNTVVSQLSLTAVPEPSTFAMIFGGLGILLLGRRR